MYQLFALRMSALCGFECIAFFLLSLSAMLFAIVTNRALIEDLRLICVFSLAFCLHMLLFAVQSLYTVYSYSL